VRWHRISDPKRYYKTACQTGFNFSFQSLNQDSVTGATGQTGTDPVAPRRVPQVETSSTTISPNGTMMILTCLAKLHPIILSNQNFNIEEDANIAAHLSGVETAHDQRAWRPLASFLDKEHIAGWASVEHPNFQGRRAQGFPGGHTGPQIAPGAPGAQGPDMLYALHLDKFEHWGGSMGLGHFWGSHTVYYVLIVRRVGFLIDGFERVGVGRLFGRESDRDFEGAKMRWLRLV